MGTGRLSRRVPSGLLREDETICGRIGDVMRDIEFIIMIERTAFFKRVRPVDEGTGTLGEPGFSESENSITLASPGDLGSGHDTPIIVACVTSEPRLV